MSNDTQGVSTRRKFLGMAGMMGAGAVLASCANGATNQPPKPAKANLDAAIFNFALNLEYLEAAFYLAAAGRLSELKDVGGDPTKVILPAGFDGTKPIAGLSANVTAYLNETATDEKLHVAVIRKVLGSAAVAQPTLDLGPAFVAAGKAASGGKIDNFNPYANELFFLHGAFIFEDVGVSAYKGAARFLVDDSAGGNLENAAGILAVEAYHSGSIRTQLYARKDEIAAAGLTVAQVVQAISDLRDGADGTTDLDQGIVDSQGSNIVPADANALAFSRTPKQVANIVTLGDISKNMGKGGFFPDGLSPFPNLDKLLAL